MRKKDKYQPKILTNSLICRKQRGSHTIGEPLLLLNEWK